MQANAIAFSRTDVRGLALRTARARQSRGLLVRRLALGFCCTFWVSGLTLAYAFLG